MSTEVQKSKSTGKRKFHLKSRTGCLTCKKRRVKCDETKPSCKKCVNMQLVCGYTLELPTTENQIPSPPNGHLDPTSIGDSIAANVGVDPSPSTEGSGVSGSRKSSYTSISETAGNTAQNGSTPLPNSISDSVSTSSVKIPTIRLPVDDSFQDHLLKNPLLGSPPNKKLKLESGASSIQQQHTPSDTPTQSSAAALAAAVVAATATEPILPSPSHSLINTSDLQQKQLLQQQQLASILKNVISGSPTKQPNYASLLNAGNLNNLNLSHLVNNLTGFGDLDSIGNLLSLPNLATMANLPIDFENLSGVLNDNSGNLLKTAANAFLKAGEQVQKGLQAIDYTQSTSTVLDQSQLQLSTLTEQLLPQSVPQSIPQSVLQSVPQSVPQSVEQQVRQQAQQAPQTLPIPPEGANILSQILGGKGSDLADGANILTQMLGGKGSDLAGGANILTQMLGGKASDLAGGASILTQMLGKIPTGSDPAALLAAAAVTAMQPAETTDIPTTNKNDINETSTSVPSLESPYSGLNMIDLRLMFHYNSQVSSTITGAGISDTNIWNYDIPMLAFEFPFLMHSILAFSATHLSRTEKGLDQCVTTHRGQALRLLREAVLNINPENTDALVASALILIMDSLANASFPSSTSPKSLPASAWIFHVKGAATILTAVWPLSESSRFHKFISVDLSDLGDIMNKKVDLNSDINKSFANLECHDSDIVDLFPVTIGSPYLITLAYLNKLHKERYKSDFILRIFAFPALLDKAFLSLLMMGDTKAMRIMRSYYKLLRSFTTEMKDKVWFLEGVLNILPVDVEEYAGGAGGMHMMLDFLGGGPTIIENEIEEEMERFDPGQLSTKLTDPNNLPSDITSNLDVMGDNNSFLDMK